MATHIRIRVKLEIMEKSFRKHRGFPLAIVHFHEIKDAFEALALSIPGVKITSNNKLCLIEDKAYFSFDLRSVEPTYEFASICVYADNPEIADTVAKEFYKLFDIK